MADYHCISVNQFKPVVKRTATALRRLKPVLGFEQIVCTGISGQSIAWPVGYVTGIPVDVVRRKGERGHHGYTVENFARDKPYIILDDFVSSGSTIKYMVRTLNKEKDAETSLCVGVFCYDPTWTRQVTIDKTKLFVYDKDSRKKVVETTM